MTSAAEYAADYQSAGVNEDASGGVLSRMTPRIRGTWPETNEFGAVRLDIGQFANVIDIGGIGLAICTDGVGSKALLAQMVGRYDTIGIDCVAMNVNDLVCVGARPISMVDYIAVEHLDPKTVDQILEGLCAGAETANISLSGGEIAQLPDMMKGYRQGQGFDVVGMAVGVVDLDHILTGQGIEHGDVVVGVESNGIHSNGLSLARKIFFDTYSLTVDVNLPKLDAKLGEELLKPTHIYVAEALDVVARVPSVKAMVHITSDGFLNLNRVQSEIGYVLDSLPPVPRIFELIKDYGEVPAEEMYSVYNLGVGFCFVVSAEDAESVISIVSSHNKRQACVIGTVDAGAPGSVTISENAFSGRDLIGEGKTFRAA